MLHKYLHLCYVNMLATQSSSMVTTLMLVKPGISQFLIRKHTVVFKESA